MADFENVLAEANSQIAIFVASDLPSLAPMMQALAKVDPFLPVDNPTPHQAQLVREYHQNLQRLKDRALVVSVRLHRERAEIIARRNTLKVARAYQQ